MKLNRERAALTSILIAPIMKILENKKEVIHPQVPLRIPCDDLTHLTELRFGAFTQCVSPEPCSVGLTGGVCKAQGHIHRKMLTSGY